MPEATCPKAENAIDCSLMLTPDIVGSRNKPVMKNLTCVMHVHVHPSEFLTIMAGVKDVTDNSDATDKLVGLMCDIAEKLDLTIKDVKVVDADTLATKSEGGGL